MKIFLLLLGLFRFSSGLNNGLARTPPMGWMSWQRFRCITDCVTYPEECISDSLFRRTADLMVSEGYLAAGYEYLIIDDCWLAKTRDAQGRLQPDPARFPYGIKDLADYIHGKGLKFGIYEDYGNYTCAGYPGILGHLEIDANTFAEWEVDYIKIDGCYADFDDYEKGYTEFGHYLNKTGRPIVYSCSWPAYLESKGIHANYTLLGEICNLWRNWGDIQDSYESMTKITRWFASHQDRIQPHAGPGHWNDPDMLLIGNFGLSYEQSKAQMAIWAILAAPLLLSVDFATIKPEYKDILLNKKLIVLNQDALGIQGKLVSTIENIDIWVRPVMPIVEKRYSYAIVFHSNRDDGYPFAIRLTLNTLGLVHAGGYHVQNLYEDNVQDRILNTNEEFAVKVKPSGTVLLKAEPVKRRLYNY